MIFLRRVKRVILLVCCLGRALFYGSADKVSTKITRIVVVPTGKLGDVVCATPVLLALRSRFPTASIIVAGNSKLHRVILSDSGLVDEYVELENESGAVSRLKKCRADAAIVTGPSYQAIAFLYLAGIPLVVGPRVEGGFSPFETRPYKILKKFIKTFPYDIGAYAPRERLRALEALGIFSDDTKKHLGFSEIADKKVSQFFSENGIDLKKDFLVGISPSAGNKIKEWPEERFSAVADHLLTTYNAKILVIGGPGDKEKVSKTIDGIKAPGVSNKKILGISDFNIDELKALVSTLNIFIAVDTGPIYIAEAFEVPTIDIVGPVDERVQPPRGPIHRNVVPPGRVRAQLSILNARSYDTREASRQVLSITITMVLKEIDFLLKDLGRMSGML